MRLAALLEHFSNGARVRRGHYQLASVRLSFCDDGGRLAPDQFRTAGAESSEPPERQLIRLAVQRPVAPFHRLNAETIADSPTGDLDRLKQRRQVIRQTDSQPEPFALGLHVRQGFEFEVV